MSALSYWQQLDSLVSQWKEQHPTDAQLRRRMKKAMADPAKAKPPRTPLTLGEMALVGKLQECSFPPGGSHKRFVRGLTMDSELSDRGRQYLAYIAHRYRRQWKPNAEEFEWIAKWGTWIQPPKERN